MDFATNYEISLTAGFIRSRNFTRVALQFPDDLLKDSTRVASALRDELRSLEESEGLECRDVGVFVMADTTYGSCCVDEVGASHIDADCVVHYGHTCMSPTSTLPALFVFGKAAIAVNTCVESLSHCLTTSNKPILVLFGLEYAHAVQSIKEKLVVESSMLGSSKYPVLHYADVMCSVMNPSNYDKALKGELESSNGYTSNGNLLKCVNNNNILCPDHCKQNTLTITSYNLGGLTWSLPQEHNIEDYLLFWIGPDNPAFANVVLTFNNCEIVRYDADDNRLVKDLSHQRRILKRRYYLVEKAKDANIVGILVGTLGVAGYLHMINQMKELIKGAGKKAYTLVMGRPNPAKLANFPECDVFIYVSCAETALLDSKEFLAPVITPFEAMLAFNRGSQWTGAYVMGFRDLMASASPNVSNCSEEARFSFLEGRYVEDLEPQGKAEEKERVLVLAEATEKALNVRDRDSTPGLVKGIAKSGAEFFVSRSYHGLEMQNEKAPPQAFVMGRTGKASGYKDEEFNMTFHDH